MLVRLTTGFGKSAVIRLAVALQCSRGGKPLTYIVLEPYTALMHDQVRATEREDGPSDEAYIFRPPQMQQVGSFRFSFFI